MANKIVSKGTRLQQTISAAFVDVALVRTLSHSGAESETVDSRTLDTDGAGVPHDPNGWSEGGSWDFDFFFDPGLSGHRALFAGITTPAKKNYKVIFVDSGNTEMAFTGAGIGVDIEVDPANLLSASASVKCDQLTTYPA